ncbi:MAG: hypothetical protein FWH59_02175 [Lentimicrobiaceae bacterium]|nr:hypothetical protein [Lentimicrobiaceae bacterium]
MKKLTLTVAISIFTTLICNAQRSQTNTADSMVQGLMGGLLFTILALIIFKGIPALFKLFSNKEEKDNQENNSEGVESE